MKVLWVTNIPVGGGASAMDVMENPFGGWLDGLWDQIVDQRALDVGVAFPLPRIRSLTMREYAGVSYFAFPASGHAAEKALRSLLLELVPDVVHIFGTEMPHSNMVVKIAREIGLKFVVQLQGLMGPIESHRDAWLRPGTADQPSLVGRARGKTTTNSARAAREAALREAETLRITKHVIGRTTFDRAVVTQLNPEVQYHECNECLRAPFYEDSWSIDAVRRQTIHFSQATTPLKGLHVLLDALPAIRQHFPELRVRISGPNIMASGVIGALKRTGYGAHLRSRIAESGFMDAIDWLGVQDAVGMKRAYLGSHVFVSASSVENESNSLSEAKILGMPVVASFVGGVVDRITHGESGFHYPGDAPYMLAHYVCRILDDDHLAVSLGEHARQEALAVNDRRRNASVLLSIYDQVLR